MKTLKVLKINLLVICIFVLLSLFTTGEAKAATDYYVSPSGSGTTCSSGSPCALSTGLGKSLVGDDRLILKDGTYTGTSLTVPWSGTSGHPITIKAENDGQAIVDGQNTRKPLNIVGTSGSHKTDITVEGIVFKNSNDSVVIVQYADRIILKRVSGYNALVNGNVFPFDLWVVTNTLLQDCVASGTGRVMINVLDSDRVTVRRCYTRWTQYTGTYGMGWGVQIYGTTNSIVENCIAIRANEGNAGGIAIWSHYYSRTANNNKIYGNVVNNAGYWIGSATKNITGNEFINNVVINSQMGLQQRADDGLLVSNLTAVSISGPYPYHFNLSEDITDTQNSDFKLNTNLKNSSFLTDGVGIVKENSAHTDYFNHTYNNLYGLITNYRGTTAGIGEIYVNPAYNTATYGKGAYLMIPAALKRQGEGGADIGATVLYRYKDGVLTNEPLWPWPMEDRIKNETGISVTYEANGGLWKTLDGVYAGTPVDTDTTPPAVPTVLTATAVSTTQVNLSWTASTDNVGVAGYKVYRNGSQITTVTGTTYTNTGLTASTAYIYNVSAYDAAGNVSSQSAAASATTQATQPIVVSSITALKTELPITFDGNLAESAWGQANSVTFSNSARSDNQVKVYTLWDDANLYFAYDVTDLNLEAINQAYYEDDGEEIYLDTANNKSGSMDSDDYHFIININDLTYSTGIRSKTLRRSNDYTMEIAIPWSAIGVIPTANKSMGILLGNNDRDNNVSSQFDWLNLINSGSYNRPNLWGNVILSSQTISDTLAPAAPSDISAR